ncbi:MAG: ubiquitin-like protein Pup [Actinomycetota bacterium]
MPQEQERKQVEKREAEQRAEADQAEATTKGEKLKEEMDDILDEIDSVLEENAEEFIKSYVQKGGQ